MLFRKTTPLRRPFSKLRAPAILATSLICSSVSYGAISWSGIYQGTDSTLFNPYTAGSNLNVVAGPDSDQEFKHRAPTSGGVGTFTGLEFNFSSNTNGTLHVEELVAEGPTPIWDRLHFVTGQEVAAGQSLTMRIDFGDQIIGSGVSSNDPASYARLAFQFREFVTSNVINQKLSIEKLGVGLTDGGFTVGSFLNDWGGTDPYTGTPLTPLTSFSTGNGLYFDGDPISLSTDADSVFTGFEGDKATFLPENSGLGTKLHELEIADFDRPTTDYIATGWEFTITNNNTETIPVGTQFTWTIEGKYLNRAVPEPSTFFLLALTSGLSLWRRRR